MNNDTITRYVNKYEKIGREFTIEMLNEIRKKGIKVNYRCTPTTAKHDMNVILNDKEHIIIEIKCRRYPSTHYYFQDGLFIHILLD